MFFPRAAKFDFSVVLGGNSSSTAEPLSQLLNVLGSYDADRTRGASNHGRYSSPFLDALLAKASVTLDDDARNAMTAQAFDFAIGQDCAVVPVLFPTTSWAMRADIRYGGYLQETTVASMAHLAK